VMPDTWFVKTDERAVRGIPDILMCVAGRFVAMELKASEKAKIDALQEYNLKKIKEAGGISIIVHPGNWELAYEILINLANGEEDYDHIILC
jgi:hypothetical protein